MRAALGGGMVRAMTTIPVIDPSTRSVTYAPVASAGPFVVDWPMFSPDGAGLEVTLDGVELLGWSYAGELVDGFYGAPSTYINGAVTLASAVTGSLTIKSTMTVEREGQFAEGRGTPARDLNHEFNRQAAFIQEARRDIDNIVGLEDRLESLENSINGFTPTGTLLLASEAEAIAGTNTTKAISPATLDSVLDAALPAYVRSRYPEAYGTNVGSGSVSAIAAILAAAADHSGRIEGKPGSTYLIDAAFTLPNSLHFDLNGSTLLINYSGTGAPLLKSPAYGTAYTVTTMVAGSVSIITSAPATDISIGDTVQISSNVYSSRWPVLTRKVVGKNADGGGGSEVVLDCAPPWTTPGTVTIQRIAYHGDDFALVNGNIDASGMAAGAGGLTNAGGFRTIRFEGLRVTSPAATLTGSNGFFHVQRTNTMEFKDIRVDDFRSYGGLLSAYSSTVLTAEDVHWTGDAFGLAGVFCETQFFRNIKGRGRWPYAGNASIRGIRCIGYQHFSAIGTTFSGYSDAIKCEDGGNNTIIDLNAHRCSSAVNMSNQNNAAEWGRTLVSKVRAIECASPIGDLSTAPKGKTYSDIYIHAPTLTGLNIAGQNLALNGIQVSGYPAGYNPIYISEQGGVIPTGLLDNTQCEGSGNGIYIVKTAVNFMVGPNVKSTGGTGGFSQRPPVWAGETLIAQAVVNMQSTADQAITVKLPAGCDAYRLSAAIMTNLSATSAAAAVGGIFTDPAKAGTAIVAAAQVYTSMTGLRTNQNLSVAGVQVMTDTSLYFKLDTAADGATTGLLQIYGYPQSPVAWQA